MEPPRVKVLVEVANIQTRTLKTEVEKSSMCTAVEHGLIGPKRWEKSVLTSGRVSFS